MTDTITSINHTPIKRNFIKDLPFNPNLKKQAKLNRKAGYLSEIVFWKAVRDKSFHSIDFDRQRIIGNYIVDFYVKTLGLVIEIDGASHANKTVYDSNRQLYIESFGVKVYRVSDGDVMYNLQQVMDELELFIIKEYGV